MSKRSAWPQGGGAKIKPMGTPIDLLEVFRSSNSSLTDQVNKQGGKAMRFEYCQGDLQTTEGRRNLFAQVARHRPKHVWLSPRCGPWSYWSRFNSQRSLESWDEIQSDTGCIVSSPLRAPTSLSDACALGATKRVLDDETSTCPRGKQVHTSCKTRHACCRGNAGSSVHESHA